MKRFAVVLAVVLIGLLGGIVGFAAVIVYTVAITPPQPATGLTLIELPLHLLALGTVAGIVSGCWWQWRRERRRAGAVNWTLPPWRALDDPRRPLCLCVEQS